MINFAMACLHKSVQITANQRILDTYDLKGSPQGQQLDSIQELPGGICHTNSPCPGARSMEEIELEAHNEQLSPWSLPFWPQSSLTFPGLCSSRKVLSTYRCVQEQEWGGLSAGDFWWRPLGVSVLLLLMYCCCFFFFFKGELIVLLLILTVLNNLKV